MNFQKIDDDYAYSQINMTIPMPSGVTVASQERLDVYFDAQGDESGVWETCTHIFSVSAVIVSIISSTFRTSGVSNLSPLLNHYQLILAKPCSD